MSKTYPKLTDEQHMGIYLAGIHDEELVAELHSMRKHWKGPPWELKQLISNTQEPAEREAGLLQERLDGPMGLGVTTTQQQKAQNRLQALQKLLGHSEAAAPPAPRPRPPADPKVRPTALPPLRTAREYSTYANAPCSVHPNAQKPHTNAECIQQRQKLGQVAHGLIAETTLLAAQQPSAPMAPPGYSSSSVVPPAYVDWGGGIVRFLLRMLHPYTRPVLLLLRLTLLLSTGLLPARSAYSANKQTRSIRLAASSRHRAYNVMHHLEQDRQHQQLSNGLLVLTLSWVA